MGFEGSWYTQIVHRQGGCEIGTEPTKGDSGENPDLLNTEGVQLIRGSRLVERVV